jgi:hypothetical protein
LLSRLPEVCAKTLSVFPLEQEDDAAVALACAVMPGRNCIIELEAALGMPVKFRLARRGDLAAALRDGYARLKAPGADAREISPVTDRSLAHRPIEELLIDIGAISSPDLDTALSEAARCGKDVVEYLLANGRIRQEHVAEAMKRQHQRERQFIDPIVAVGEARGRALPGIGHVAADD